LIWSRLIDGAISVTFICSGVARKCKPATPVKLLKIESLNSSRTNNNMTNVKIPYYSVRRNGRGFWEPRPHMRTLGFFSIACGPDGPDAWAVARQWHDRWQSVKSGKSPAPAMITAANLSPETAEHLTVYPPRSLGEAFRRYRNTTQWTDGKKPRTREDWWRAWKWIKPVFGDCDPRTVTLEGIDAWRGKIEAAVSLREAHRCVKIWRALWRVAAALGYCISDADPSRGVRNRAAPGRSETWTEGEVVRLFKRAWRDGYHGLAAAIAVAWSTQLSPGDVRSLRASQLARSAAGAVCFQDRAKTGKPVGGALTDRALAALDAYTAGLGVELHGEAYIFRNRSGAPYSSDTLGDDFRDVRRALFGDRESRTLADFRRSGAVEAIAGNASAAQLAHAMGNTLSTSNSLFATYVPVNMTSIRAVMDARRVGRGRIRGHK
jgi:integrase